MWIGCGGVLRCLPAEHEGIECALYLSTMPIQQFYLGSPTPPFGRVSRRRSDPTFHGSGGTRTCRSMTAMRVLSPEPRAGSECLGARLPVAVVPKMLRAAAICASLLLAHPLPTTGAVHAAAMAEIDTRRLLGAIWWVPMQGGGDFSGRSTSRGRSVPTAC